MKRCEFHGYWGGGTLARRPPLFIGWRYDLHAFQFGPKVNRTWISIWHYLEVDFSLGLIHLSLTYSFVPGRGA